MAEADTKNPFPPHWGHSTCERRPPAPYINENRPDDGGGRWERRQRGMGTRLRTRRWLHNSFEPWLTADEDGELLLFPERGNAQQMS